MKKVSIAASKQSRNISQQKLTIGLDLGERNCWYCVVDEAGQIHFMPQLAEQATDPGANASRFPVRSDCAACRRRLRATLSHSSGLAAPVRFVSLPPLVLAWVFFLKFGLTELRPSLTAWAVWLALSFSPIDVLPIPKGGPPRLVPLVMGLPRPETVARAKQGKVILGGCIVSGFEPKYYFVW